MTKSVYVIGGAGTGKSTFTQELLDMSNRSMDPLEDFHSRRNAKALVTLRGHRVGIDGVYLGCMRDEFPGTDGLDRATSPTAAEWLRQGGQQEFKWLVGEGATLATRPFMEALAEETELIVVHLVAEDFVKEIRFASRGSNQDPTFVTATATRSANLARDLAKYGVQVLEIDSADPGEWGDALLFCFDHLGL